MDDNTNNNGYNIYICDSQFNYDDDSIDDDNNRKYI